METSSERKLNRPEILAPVGGEEQLVAALRCGADAVYFGLQDFNARRNASNFNTDNLEDVIRRCHERLVKVYITINTLVLEDELENAKKLVDVVAKAHADAIIVQDFAVAAYAKANYPYLKLFASTQMAVHNSEGVKLLTDFGFDRVVLARELSLKEIKAIIDSTQADVEVFVHGAHCMSLSGNCYLSSMIGGRSGNRGLCAQPCRLDCKTCGRDYALSLKDMSYVSHINELADAGVGSLKIEGRMKRAEYVAAAVTACKNALEHKAYDLDVLQSVFSRSGFTDGYLTGKRGLDMFGHRTKDDVLAASDVLKDLAKTYEKETPVFPLKMLLTLSPNLPSSLTIDDGQRRVTVYGEIPETARTITLNKDTAAKNLGKLGGTPYYLEELVVDSEGELTLSMSALNDLRRRCIEDLNERRVKEFAYDEKK